MSQTGKSWVTYKHESERSEDCENYDITTSTEYDESEDLKRPKEIKKKTIPEDLVKHN